MMRKVNSRFDFKLKEEKIVKSKRSQAAMEFLMTYGWAILAAVIVIAVLAYFGVFSPATYVPNQCTVSAPFGCNAGTVSTTAVTLELRNGAGETLTVQSVNVAGCGILTPIAGSDEATIDDGELDTYVVTCSLGALTANTKFKGAITTTYRKVGSSLDLTSSGQIVDTV